MIVHIALFKWKPDVPNELVSRLMGNIKNLKGQIPSLVDIMSGENFSKYNEGFTHAVVAIFKDREGLDAYRVHPLHKPVAGMADKMEEKSIGIDFEA